MNDETDDTRPGDPAVNIRGVIDHLLRACGAYLGGNTRECRGALKAAELALALTRASFDKHHPVKLKRGAK